MLKPPRRKRFQIHLSTAIVMMFVAGGLLWANISKRTQAGTNLGVALKRGSSDSARLTEAEFLSDSGKDTWFGSNVFIYGWPFNATRTIQEFVVEKHSEKREPGEPYIEWLTFSIVLNLLITILFLALTWFLCELLIHRRSVKQGA